MSAEIAAVPRDFWERARLGWHATAYGVFAVAALTAMAGGDWVRVGAAVTAAVAYALLGTRAIERQDTRIGLVYLLVAYSCFIVLALRDGTGFVLLFVLYPQTFAIFEDESRALPLIGVLSGLSGLAIWLTGDTGAWDALLTAGLNFGIAALLGLWISGIFRESEARGALIAELEAARTELAQAHRREGQLAERQRLSHEIHDTLAQGFTSIVMLSRVAARGLADGNAEVVADRLAAVEGVARENLAEARALVAALAPPPLQESPLPEALDRIVTRFGHESSIATSYEVLGDARPLPPHAEVVLLRAAQEALANVRRHAAAARVDVRLSFGPEHTRLEVTDDGRGFDPQSSLATSFGLRGMRTRLDEVGGRLAVDTGKGRGTRLCVEV